MKATTCEGTELQVGDVVSYPHERGGRATDRVVEVWCGNQVRLGHGQVVDAGQTFVVEFGRGPADPGAAAMSEEACGRGW